MKSAFALASHGLGLQPNDQQSNERLARTIMTFYDQGVRNCIVLASVASSREKLTDTCDIWNTSIEEEPPQLLSLFNEQHFGGFSFLVRRIRHLGAAHRPRDPINGYRHV
ncbi:hypothetical protein [Phyllobacterium myrsinacearum]|uniref:hypothetical protein n=1 Tax=Phyllobacterium myrsinacearum TaxID=28101 RepID=UPI00102A6069|nr:hypothetical protein [Phyllobacterium myrsinacearum]